MKQCTEAENLRRKSVASGAACAALAAVPALSATHGHLWLVGVCIGVQVCLIVMSARFLVRSKRLASRSS